ncbi:DeoR/GlpR family DNA-binding transcription regulator [Streptococcus zalophi]|uniref:Lactose phosphotransferase system repressor n=1 Tax=Streptococcus zalophi TaxID=640031 RepID=A0A934UDI8_9STRE|nr:DeoR/GlpR family DNA-binding transcription regulator [Streptococcus zalophi]MBJ8349713.1 DeoR/GlpR transcriptional regulator [Streptococcus zalophi]MCR8967938.1 DeoR/GlpR family DNA-binding transcription regulator [Streptococcus zalophi]
MLKRERLQRILEKVNNEGLITVQEIIAELDVSDMTVRRDLDELEKNGKLIRVHGGAQSISQNSFYERSNTEKLTKQINEKKEIAAVAATLINDGETIFLGPGTTIECLARELRQRKLRIITNSLPVFNILKDSQSVDLILLGGEYRDITGAFVGSFANNYVKSLKFSKSFISANAIYKDRVATYSESEGELLNIVLNNSIQKILLVDYTKFGRYDFYVFYKTNYFDYLITDSNISQENQKIYNQYTEIIIPKNTMK